jgi:hypothetical protein
MESLARGETQIQKTKKGREALFRYIQVPVPEATDRLTARPNRFDALNATFNVVAGAGFEPATFGL